MNQARETVIGAFQKKTCSKDEEVIKQGEDGDYYYILDSGHTNVFIKKGEDRNPKLEIIGCKPLNPEPFTEEGEGLCPKPENNPLGIGRKP